MSQDNLTLKQRIQKMAGDDEPFKPEEFQNIILDDTPTPEISAEDRDFLNTFVNMEKFCMNHTGLRSLLNLPTKLKLTRVSKPLSYNPNRLNLATTTSKGTNCHVSPPTAKPWRS